MASILLVTPAYSGTGGIQTLAQNIECGLQERGHDVDLLHVDPGERVPSLPDLLPRPEWMAGVVDVTEFNWPHRNAVARLTSSQFERRSYDIVHAIHGVVWPAIDIGRRHGCRTVLTTHALELGRKTIMREAIRHADVVHCVSAYGEELTQDLVGPELNTNVVSPLIDTGKYRNSVPKEKTVSCVCRMVERKGVGTLVEAWKMLDPALRSEWSLVLAGSGPKLDEYQRLADGLDSVTFPGYVPEEQKRRLLAKSELFAMPATKIGYDAEGFGIVYLEAQASNTPVLGSYAGGIPDAVGDGGVLVENERDPSLVGKVITRLLENSSKREELRTNAKRRITRFDIPKKIRQYESMYSVGNDHE